MMRLICRSLTLAFVLSGAAFASDDAVSYAVQGKFFDDHDQPTYQVQSDGTVDWYTAQGKDAYRDTCQNCHGPRGDGSTYGISLTNSVKTMRYFDFVDTTVNGQVNTLSGQARVMPAFGTNVDVICSLDAIYIYLRAEAAKVLGEDPDTIRAVQNAKADQELSDCLAE